MRIRSKLLGDAGEHYALSQFSFAGKYAAKMPDNGEGYDLAVETGSALVRVSVKTRSESAGWKSSKWFTWDDRKSTDWFVFIFKPIQGDVRAWIIPEDLVKSESNRPGLERKQPWLRELSWQKLNGPSLSSFEGNWTMNQG